MTPHDETARAVLSSLTAHYSPEHNAGFYTDVALIAAALREAHAQGLEEAAQIARAQEWIVYGRGKMINLEDFLAAGAAAIAQAATVRKGTP